MSSNRADPGDSLDALGALAEPNRRALYDYVVAAGTWVSRDQAAGGVGLQRSVAAHHLDRLADDGLVEVDYLRLTGRSGPGAGRPSKMYRRSQREFEVALPPRDYELAGRLLAEAVDASTRTGSDIATAVDEAARRHGRLLGQAMQKEMGRSGNQTQAREAALAVLVTYGFEPVEVDGDTIVLRNCPFHQLAQTHTELICGLNHSMVDAALAELGAGGLEASLEPDPDTCCVRLRRA